jgi:regulator of sigma E protease
LELLSFILLVSALIFIHEAGHFAFARLFGVKVLEFSIGFGPKLIRLRGRETEYCIGIFPFGGFVKLLEESKLALPIAPEDKKRSFEARPLWQRMVIVLAGPLMNVLFPVLLFAAVYMDDREFAPPTIGVIFPGRPAEGKLRLGDRILSVDGKKVSNFPELTRLIADKPGQELRLAVDRGGRQLDVALVADDDREVDGLDRVTHVGRLGVMPIFQASAIGIARQDSPAAASGLRTFDVIVAVNGRKIERFVELVEQLSANDGASVIVSYLRPGPVTDALGGLGELALYTSGITTLTPLRRERVVKPLDDVDDAVADVLARTGLESSDMYVAFVPEGSSEWRAGLRVGDRVVTLNGKPQRLWQAFKEQLKANAAQKLDIAWMRNGQPMAGSFQVRKERWTNEVGQPFERYVFRTQHFAPEAKMRTVPNERRLAYALTRGVSQTWEVMGFVTTGVVRIFQGRMSLRDMSGPITIFDIAGRAAARGTSDFMWAMALISINLGLINLLPIPVLDGGHLLFFTLEGVMRRPVSQRVREVLSLAGMAFLILLMAVAFKNDVEKRWDVIREQLRAIVS